MVTDITEYMLHLISTLRCGDVLNKLVIFRSSLGVVPIMSYSRAWSGEVTKYPTVYVYYTDSTVLPPHQ